MLAVHSAVAALVDPMMVLVPTAGSAYYLVTHAMIVVGSEGHCIAVEWQVQMMSGLLHGRQHCLNRLLRVHCMIAESERLLVMEAISGLE